MIALAVGWTMTEVRTASVADVHAMLTVVTARKRKR